MWPVDLNLETPDVVDSVLASQTRDATFDSRQGRDFRPVSSH